MSGFNCSGSECSLSYAGGLLNTEVGTMYVNNSTISGNSCVVSGGGIANASGTVTISSSTIVGNTCGLGGGVTASDTVNLKNTIVANNTATEPGGGDGSGMITSQGYNLIKNGSGSLVVGDLTGNIIGADPNLGPLQNNGGFTPTRALIPGSPAFNSGNPAGCRNQAGALLTTDQRGNLRPSQGRCDMGAFELAPSVVLWAADNAAHTWLLNGSTFAGMAGFGGPAPGWTAAELLP